MINEKYFGDILKKDIVKDFYNISVKVNDFTKEILDEEYDFEEEPYNYTVKEILKYSFETSQSFYLILSQNIIRSAYALLRIRLEQMILSSYLINSNEEDGLKKYILNAGISLYKSYNSSASFSSQSKAVLDQLISAIGLDEEQYKQIAIDSQKEKRSNFNYNEDKFDRDWTSLDLRSMAKKRDELVKNSDDLFTKPIEHYYTSLYKGGNSVIHSDVIIISSSFNSVLDSMWQKNLSLNNAYFDMVQCYEISKYLGKDFKKEFEKLNKEYFDRLAKALSNLF